jgi:shikimate kinase
MKRNLYLIGHIAAGKTAVGEYLANLTQRIFYDVDREIERSTGATISEIFANEQEAGFRQYEAQMVEKLTQLPEIVLATGGGCILNANNRKHLAAQGLIIYLRLNNPQLQLARITAQSTSRPLLNHPYPLQQLQLLNQQREPWYLALAQQTYDADDFSTPQLLAQHIYQNIYDHSG